MKEGWETKCLEEVCIIGDGNHSGNYPKSKEMVFEGVPFIRGTNLIDGKVSADDMRFITSEKHEILKKGHLKTGDILFTNRGQVGKKAIVDKRFDGANLNSQVAWFRCNEHINNRYMFYNLESPEVLSFISKNTNGTALQQLTIRQIRKLQLVVPPLTEQKQIVEILDKAFTAIDQAKANIEKNIQNAKEFSDSKMEELFEELASEYAPVPIAEACDKIFAGGDAPKDNFSKDKTEEFNIPIIANAVKKNGLYGYTNEARVTQPSITIAARGSGTGHTEYREYPFTPIVRLIVLTPNTEKINVEFLMYAIKNLTIMRSGSAIPQLTVPMIKGYSIPAPRLHEQVQIVDILNKLDVHLVEYKLRAAQKLESLKELKKSILQKAFAGELTTKDLVI